MSIWPDVAKHIAATTGRPFVADAQRVVDGGCINAASVVQGGDQRYFVKFNDAAKLDMFTAEAAGLNEIAQAQAIRVPAPICWGTSGNQAYLVLEYVEQAQPQRESMAQLGQALAQLHRRLSEHYGWHRDNTIGATLQVNTPSTDWVDFWQRHRLGFQLELAKRNGHGGKLQRRGERLVADLGAFFRAGTPVASLLHGDLWSGNYTFDEHGHPVIFDPAVYYGDRETDLAMTELFGGFPSRFYDAYREAYPLEAGYAVRKTFYNLYHVLNHLNLFGGGYLSQAERMINMLLAEVE
jgi:protein-ribulosamine 3-kinase